MKNPEYGAENEERVEFCGQYSSIPTPGKKSETGSNRIIRGFKLGGVVLVGILICGIIIVLVGGMWILLTVIFSAISGIPLHSPICWVIGGILPGLTFYIALSQKGEGKINPLQ